MNKNKLRSLMFHAGFCNEDGGWDTRPIHEQEHDNFQRFAELIVAECVKVAMRSVSEDEQKEAWYLIQEHFGVEE